MVVYLSVTIEAAAEEINLSNFKNNSMPFKNDVQFLCGSWE